MQYPSRPEATVMLSQLHQLLDPATPGPRPRPGLWTYERALTQAGLAPVAGVDEAGRGACAGPLVIGAAILNPARRPPELADSKLLSPAQRERVYDSVTRLARAWSVVVIPAADVDRYGLHRMNIEGMRRALAQLQLDPGYVLTDGFAVPGLATPALAVWKGDQVSASVAAASVIAKVTRDRMMVQLEAQFPGYGFALHKGYCTAAHTRALQQLGPCAQHRFSYANVAAVAGHNVENSPLPAGENCER